MSTFEEQFLRPVRKLTHYIYNPEAKAHWPELGGVCGALTFQV